MNQTKENSSSSIDGSDFDDGDDDEEENCLDNLTDTIYGLLPEANPIAPKVATEDEPIKLALGYKFLELPHLSFDAPVQQDSLNK